MNRPFIDTGTAVLHVGIDVGSTTAKIAVLDTSHQLVFSDYRRHFGEQGRCVRDLLELVETRFPRTELRVAMCGSGGRHIADHLGVDFVQEVVANSIAVKHLHPEARTAIELGGQDAKIIFFHRDDVSGQLIASDMRMNGVCAGGTGAFIDEIAQLLKIPVEDFNAHAERGKQVHQVSGRCGVFAKTDIQPLLNQGVDKPDLALSTLHAVAKQTIGGLAQGTTIQAPVVFEGGPLTFNRRLVAVFAEHLHLEDADIIVPAQPEIIVALGCALATDSTLIEHGRTHSANALLQRLGTLATSSLSEGDQDERPMFASDADRRDFFARHHRPAEIHFIPSNHGRLDVTLGIDCGSTTSKFVFLDENDQIVAAHYANNEGAPLDVLRKALIAVRDEARARGTELNVVGAGTTGYGEDLTAAAFHADHHAVSFPISALLLHFSLTNNPFVFIKLSDHIFHASRNPFIACSFFHRNNLSTIRQFFHFTRRRKHNARQYRVSRTHLSDKHIAQRVVFNIIDEHHRRAIWRTLELAFL